MQVAIIGLGLMGSSMALALKKVYPSWYLVGVDAHEEAAAYALSHGVVDKVSDLDSALTESLLIVFAIPVDATLKLLPKALDCCLPEAVVTDLGSTKAALWEAVQGHVKRNRYVPAHPMAGSEKFGAGSGQENLFDGKMVVLCPDAHTDADAVKVVSSCFESIGMRMMYMDAKAHDVHVAYISHFPHLVSFSLVQTVLNKEESEGNILALAAGGFSSMARLSKSSPDMWLPIFMQNKAALLAILEEYQVQLAMWKEVLESGDEARMRDFILQANLIRSILDFSPKSS